MGRRKHLEPENPNNIVTTWIHAETKLGNTIESAMQSLNNSTGNHYAVNRAYLWERGRNLPGRNVFNYMLSRTIPVVLSDLKISHSKAVKISEKLTMPKSFNE